MLKIEKNTGGCVTKLRLSGRIRSDQIESIRSEMDGDCATKILLPVFALASRIRLSSSEPVLQEAEQVIRTIVSTYPKTNLTAEQIEAQAVNGQDPLRQFSDVCRIELDSLQRQL